MKKQNIEYWISQYSTEIKFVAPCTIPHYTKEEICERAEDGFTVAKCKTLKEAEETYKKDFLCYTGTSISHGNGNLVLVEATFFVIEKITLDDDGEFDRGEIVRKYAEPFKKTKIDRFGRIDFN